MFFLLLLIIPLLDQYWISLTSNTINFTKAYLTFLDDALKLPFADSNIFVDEILNDIFQAQLSHVERSLRSGKYKGEVSKIKTITFWSNAVFSYNHRDYLYRPTLYRKMLHSFSTLFFLWLSIASKKLDFIQVHHLLNCALILSGCAPLSKKLLNLNKLLCDLFLYLVDKK